MHILSLSFPTQINNGSPFEDPLYLVGAAGLNPATNRYNQESFSWRYCLQSSQYALMSGLLSKSLSTISRAFAAVNVERLLFRLSLNENYLPSCQR